MSEKPIAAFFGNPKWIESVYGMGRMETVAGMTNLCPEIILPENFDRNIDFLRKVEVVFTTWFLEPMKAEILYQLPALKAVFYAAGSVRHFAAPLLDRDILVVSGWQANAVPVAEFAQAQIILAAKGYFHNVRDIRAGVYFHDCFRGKGNFGEQIALLGAGAIGQKVIELLHPFNLRVMVFDPFLAPEKAAELGVRRVSLEEAFSKAYVISNHIADLPETRGMIHRRLFESMRSNATFINTGRGYTVDEEGMAEVLKLRPDLTALLDVTQVEPPPEDSPLRLLPNAQLSTHIAGANNDEFIRLADYCIEEFRAWRDGEPLRYAVSKAMLETMA